MIVDGPYEIRVPAKADHYHLMIGLYQGNPVLLKGLRDKSDRIVLARLDLKRREGKIVAMASQPPKPEDFPPAVAEADFSVRLNPAGTWIDFGPLATDGSVKVHREADRLVVFPYPREKEFRVSLDLKALAPSSDPARVQVHALAAGTQEDLGPAPFQRDGVRLTLPVGARGVGRYAITWK